MKTKRFKKASGSLLSVAKSVVSGLTGSGSKTSYDPEAISLMNPEDDDDENY